MCVSEVNVCVFCVSDTKDPKNPLFAHSLVRDNMQKNLLKHIKTRARTCISSTKNRITLELRGPKRKEAHGHEA